MLYVIEFLHINPDFFFYLADPDPVINLTYTVINGILNVTWAAPNYNKTDNLTYSITYFNKTTSKVISSVNNIKDTFFVQMNLRYCFQYKIQVSAIILTRHSKRSEVVYYEKGKKCRY